MLATRMSRKLFGNAMREIQPAQDKALSDLLAPGVRTASCLRAGRYERERGAVRRLHRRELVGN
jgi:hypothetical protein